jgi:hypothetical protein
MEQERRVREPENIVWQTRTHEETAFERRLANAMEKAFINGVSELDALIEYLNAAGVLDEENRAWTIDSYRAVIARLGA